MAQRAIFILMFLYLTFIHFVFTAFTTIIISSYNRFTTNNTSWEIASTLSAYCIILSNKTFAMTSWTFYSLSRGFFWRMLRENSHSDINISLSFFMSSHSLKFNKGTRALFITLQLNRQILCYNKQLKLPRYISFQYPYQVHNLLISRLSSKPI